MAAERFIARRYLLGKKTFSFINIISLLATLGITFGVAALIVVMAVFNGFNGLVVRILQDFDPHLKVERIPKAEGKSPAEVYSILRARTDVSGLAPFVERKAMALARETNHFLFVKGIDPTLVRTVSGIADDMVLGDLSFRTPNGIVLGIHLADRMRVLVGDTLTLISPAGMENVLTQQVTPTVLRCPVAGIFESKNKLYDGGYGFLALPVAQKLFRMGKGVTGYEVRFTSIERSAEVREAVQGAVGGGWNTLTWYDLHQDLYSVMEIERWSAFILLSLIVAVAVFNILASLTMLVLEKKRDIGVLQALGLSPERIQRIFLRIGLLIGAGGVTAGLVIGLSLAFLQKQFGLIRLDSAFIIPALPIEVRISDILIIVAGTVTLCFLAAWFPARRAFRVTVIDAIRWE